MKYISLILITRQDAGVFTCTARNRQGDEVFSINARLEVVGSKFTFCSFFYSNVLGDCYIHKEKCKCFHFRA
jgi:hypothetical protein